MLLNDKIKFNNLSFYSLFFINIKRYVNHFKNSTFNKTKRQSIKDIFMRNKKI